MVIMTTFSCMFRLYLLLATTVSVVSESNLTDFDKSKWGCDARSLISGHEGKRQCVYKDSRGIPTVGIGFNLRAFGAKGKIEKLGLDYDKVLDGSQCLTDSQIMDLFEPSYQSAAASAKRAVSSFSSLCCNVAEVMIDMDYNLGGAGFASFREFIGKINAKDWSGAAADGRGTRWCSQVGRRCDDDMGRVARGCGGVEGAPLSDFESWKAEYGKVYAMVEEERAASRIWYENDALIKAHNAKNLS